MLRFVIFGTFLTSSGCLPIFGANFYVNVFVHISFAEVNTETPAKSSKS